MTNVEEDVMFADVCCVACEVLAHHAVPIGRILLVKELLDAFRDQLLVAIVFINCQIHLLLDVLLHVGSHFTDDPVDVTLSHFLFIYYLNLAHI